MGICRVGVMDMRSHWPRLPHTSDVWALPSLQHLGQHGWLSQHGVHSSSHRQVSPPSFLDLPHNADASPNVCPPQVLAGGPCHDHHPRNCLLLASGLHCCWRSWFFFFTACTPHWLLACWCSPRALLSLLLFLDSFKQLLCHAFLLLLCLLLPLHFDPFDLRITLFGCTKLSLNNLQGGIIVIRRVL